MVKAFGFLLVAGVIATGSFFATVRADDSMTTTKPAATAPAPMTCCGDDCKKMDKCCTVDDKGKVTCSMGGKCCMKAADKKSDDKGMGGMDMGK